MFEYLFGWIRNIAYYMILMTAVIQVLPNRDYKKYIRFFTGLVLILLLITPVLKLFGMEQRFSDLYDSREYESSLKEIEDSSSFLEDLDITGYFPSYTEDEEENEENEDKNNQKDIQVEEVQIGN